MTGGESGPSGASEVGDRDMDESDFVEEEPMNKKNVSKNLVCMTVCFLHWINECEKSYEQLLSS